MEKKKLKTGVLIGALIIPLLYSLFYLGAFWDPYSKLDAVPVAVVNEDQGTVIDGKERNLGKEVCDELEEQGTLKFVFTDAEDAKKGTEGNLYYAAITIPEDFSKDAASFSTEEKKTPTMEYAVNEKKNFLAAQILNMAVGQIQTEVTSNLDKEITVELADKLKEIPEQLGTVSSGFAQLDSGAKQLIDGGNTLVSGTQTLKNGMGELKNGATQLGGATTTLADGTNSLRGGMGQLQTGIDQITSQTANFDQLINGVNSLNQGATDLTNGLTTFKSQANAGLGTYKGSVDAYVGGYQTAYQLARTSPAWATLSAEQQAGLEALNNNAPAMEAGYNQLLGELNGGFDQSIGGASTLSAGIGTLASQTGSLNELNQGLLQLQTGINQAASASNDLANGSALLNSKTQTLVSGVNSLDSGANDLNTGASTLRNGIVTLDNGIVEGKTTIDEKIVEANAELPKLDGIEDVAAKPLDLEKDAVNYVPNYGTAFAPYFLSLSLWVGGLIIFFGIYLDVDKRYKYLCRDSENIIIRSFVYMGLGLAQAVVLALVIKMALGLEVANFALYLFSCGLVSLVFISIIQFCLVHLKDIGKFIALFLLILQLTSCGGTFPMETVPKFFNVMYPYMPMTYSVELFKETITGATGDNFSRYIFILTSIMVVAFLATILLSLFKKRRRDRLNKVEAVVV